MTPEQAEEQVRQDAADRMQHNTTSDLSARLMCRVGFRELTLLLAHYDGLKRAHAAARSEGPARAPVVDDGVLSRMRELAANERCHWGAHAEPAVDVRVSDLKALLAALGASQ